MSLLRESALPLLRTMGVDPYQRRHKREAERILKSIEEERGPLSQSISRQCDAYAGDVLGGKEYAPWLHVYSAIAGEFREGWIPDNFYGKKVIPHIKGQYGALSNLNAMNTILFGVDHFPDVLYLVKGRFYNCNREETALGDVANALFAEHEKVVLKLDGYSQGRGIAFFDRSTFDADAVSRLGDGVFQSFIDQHARLAAISSSHAVSTLRITTVLKANVPEVRASYLRLGAGSDTHIRSATHIRVPVSAPTGRLSEFGYTTKWKRISQHPESEIEFSSIVYPVFAKVCSIVKTLHAEIPYVHCIGWDVCVDKSGNVQIIEWNGVHNDIKFGEATQGPCFADLEWQQFA